MNFTFKAGDDIGDTGLDVNCRSAETIANARDESDIPKDCGTMRVLMDTFPDEIEICCEPKSAPQGMFADNLFTACRCIVTITRPGTTFQDLLDLKKSSMKSCKKCTR